MIFWPVVLLTLGCEMYGLKGYCGVDFQKEK